MIVRYAMLVLERAKMIVRYAIAFRLVLGSSAAVFVYVSWPFAPAYMGVRQSLTKRSCFDALHRTDTQLFGHHFHFLRCRQERAIVKIINVWTLSSIMACWLCYQCAFSGSLERKACILVALQEKFILQAKIVVS